MTTASACASCVGFFVFLSPLVQAARGEVYEVPLPEVIGEYATETSKPFSFDLGFPLADIREVRVRMAGTIVAPYVFGPFGGTGPRDGLFGLVFDTQPGNPVGGLGPRVGATMYPEPVTFVGDFAVQAYRPPTDWTLLMDGTEAGIVFFDLAGTIDFENGFRGGRGTLTSAMLIIDATPVPDPANVASMLLTLSALLRRRRARS